MRSFAQRCNWLNEKRSNEIIFLIEDAPTGGFSARALDASIFTDADELNDLHQKVREAVDCHFDPADKPKLIRLYFVRKEIIAAGIGGIKLHYEELK